MAQHEYNPFETKDEGWREKNVYQDLGHKMVATVINIRSAQQELSLPSNKGGQDGDEGVAAEPTNFDPDQFRSYPL